MTTRFVQRSPRIVLPGVSAIAWQRFAAALETQAPSVVSATGALGAYELQPRRLVELKFADNLRHEGNDRIVQVCDFIAPMTRERFLADPRLQYSLFARSIALYNQQLTTGELIQPWGATRAETLAALHIGGRGALKDWTKLFDRTRMRCDAVREIF
ncbi:MAG TPA: hypothetical protein VFI56_24265 [Vicinamibacterales bacterium]|nr:hypothetical protein [Vicinamibacterales bacterium]